MQRRTRQRDALRAHLDAADHPLSPAELLEHGQRDCPTLGLATVYRALADWLAEGWLVLVELPGAPPRYELADKPHHHHFHCRQCHRVFDLPGCPGNLARLVPAGYRLESHEVVLYGVCAQCA